MPLYIIVLNLAVYAMHLRPLYLWMCAFYLANFALFVPSAGPGYGPLWSLAVEEQFYLLWPLLIRRLSRAALARICLCLILLSPLLRGLAVARMPWLGDPYSTTWLVADNLAWGALLALFLRSRHATPARVHTLTVALTSGGLGLLGLCYRFHLTSRTSPWGAALQVVPFLALFSAFLLLALRFGRQPELLRATAPLRFLGYISYGFYLFHMLIFTAYDHLFPGDAGKLTTPVLLGRLVAVLAASSLLCLLSRKLIEDPILSLKHRLAPIRPPMHRPISTAPLAAQPAEKVA